MRYPRLSRPTIGRCCLPRLFCTTSRALPALTFLGTCPFQHAHTSSPTLLQPRLPLSTAVRLFNNIRSSPTETCSSDIIIIIMTHTQPTSPPNGCRSRYLVARGEKSRDKRENRMGKHIYGITYSVRYIKIGIDKSYCREQREHA